MVRHFFNVTKCAVAQKKVKQTKTKTNKKTLNCCTNRICGQFKQKQAHHVHDVRHG